MLILERDGDAMVFEIRAKVIRGGLLGYIRVGIIMAVHADAQSFEK